MKHKLCAACLLTIGLVATTQAQDNVTEPHFGSVTLSANFPEDPTTVAVQAGGWLNASEISDVCSGYIGVSPDVRLEFSAIDLPDALPLYVSAFSEDDTTLVISAPDGKWYCNDDGPEGFNPTIVFGPAQSGTYDIWVGSFDEDQYPDAILAISELGVDARQALAAAEGDANAESGIDMPADVQP